MINDVSPERLTATKRIINAYNAGDIEGIREIVFSSTTRLCEVYFSSVNRVFIGNDSLYSLWVSLFDAFPNGVFLTSDTVINENKQVFTRFHFRGTKILRLLIDGVPVEGDPNCIVVQSGSMVADHSHTMLSEIDLPESGPLPEMNFEGRIILQINEHCLIKKFDFSWNEINPNPEPGEIQIPRSF
eukprot:CAMPEP_0170354310 /NCGR_PEP_ID=MMETSP0117_2-20130122/34_1 /TAXON_ID=400756 /ORGANISM="Durinskia baltica, Strain CSIRO CS-38" /LENGTH=185 /DNA_ID=CAMNT_0010608259 /DNA_START=246 /DNA_END=803 /DNA_ORIENTATION=-